MINLSHIYHKFDFFRKHPTISNSSIFFDQQQQVGGGSFISLTFFQLGQKKKALTFLNIRRAFLYSMAS